MECKHYSGDFDENQTASSSYSITALGIEYITVNFFVNLLTYDSVRRSFLTTRSGFSFSSCLSQVFANYL